MTADGRPTTGFAIRKCVGKVSPVVSPYIFASSSNRICVCGNKNNVYGKNGLGSGVVRLSNGVGVVRNLSSFRRTA